MRFGDKLPAHAHSDCAARGMGRHPFSRCPPLVSPDRAGCCTGVGQIEPDNRQTVSRGHMSEDRRKSTLAVLYAEAHPPLGQRIFGIARSMDFLSHIFAYPRRQKLALLI